MLLVSPSPPERHQRALLELYSLLRAAAPPGMRVYVAPLDVRFSARVQLQPDLLVADDGPARERLDRLPLLCVELLSRGTRSRDQGTKRRVYEEAGVPSYWIVDPKQPLLTALELQGGAYAEVARIERAEPWTATLPFPVTIVPSELLR